MGIFGDPFLVVSYYNLKSACVGVKREEKSVVIKFESGGTLGTIARRTKPNLQIVLDSRAHDLTPVKNEAANVGCPFA